MGKSQGHGGKSLTHFVVFLGGNIPVFFTCQSLESEVLGKQMKLRERMRMKPGAGCCQGNGPDAHGLSSLSPHIPAPGLC